MSAFSAGFGRILLVGGGNMGGAMLRGWIDSGVPVAAIHVVDPMPGETLRALIASGGIAHSPEVPRGPFDIVIVAVKPQAMDAVLPALRPALGADTLVISIAAGKTLGYIAGRLGTRPVVRAMPNTPALIGRGITGCFAGASVTTPQRETAGALLSACGPVIWVDAEGDLDAVTAVSGSGPAYVFHLAEALAAAGEAVGLAPDLAMTLARHTIAGAGELLLRSGDTPAQLRRNVTSPHGTTQAALDVLMAEEGLVRLMGRAVAAARDRARELSSAD